MLVDSHLVTEQESLQSRSWSDGSTRFKSQRTKLGQRWCWGQSIQSIPTLKVQVWSQLSTNKKLSVFVLSSKKRQKHKHGKRGREWPIFKSTKSTCKSKVTTREQYLPYQDLQEQSIAN